MRVYHLQLAVFFVVVLVFNLFLVFEVAGVHTFSIDGWRFMSAGENIYLGRGMVVDTLWPLNEGFLQLPQQDFVSQPLFPMLLALSFSIFGPVLRSGFLVNAVLEAVNAVLTCVLAFKFTRSRKLSLLSGLLYATTKYVIIYVVNPQSESLSTFLMLVVFHLLLAKRRYLNSGFIGLFVGLAYLTHTRGFILLVAVAYFIAKQVGQGGLKHLTLILAIALIVCSPLLYRTWVYNGSLFYSPTQYALLIPTTGDDFQSSMVVPSVSELFSRVNLENMRLWLENIKYYTVGIIFDHGTVFVFAFMLLGLTQLGGVKGKRRLLLKAWFLYFALTFILVVTSFRQLRYLYLVVPLMVVLAVLGLRRGLQWSTLGGSRLQYLLYLIIVYSMVFVGVKAMVDLEPNPVVLGTLWLEDVVSEGDVVMGYWPYHADYLLEVDAVQIPSQGVYLKPMVDAYNVTYVVYMEWLDVGVVSGKEEYLDLIYDDPSGWFRVYRVEE